MVNSRIPSRKTVDLSTACNVSAAESAVSVVSYAALGSIRFDPQHDQEVPVSWFVHTYTSLPRGCGASMSTAPLAVSYRYACCPR